MWNAAEPRPDAGIGVGEDEFDESPVMPPPGRMGRIRPFHVKHLLDGDPGPGTPSEFPPALGACSTIAGVTSCFRGRRRRRSSQSSAPAVDGWTNDASVVMEGLCLGRRGTMSWCGTQIYHVGPPAVQTPGGWIPWMGSAPLRTWPCRGVAELESIGSRDDSPDTASGRSSSRNDEPVWHADPPLRMIGGPNVRGVDSAAGERTLADIAEPRCRGARVQPFDRGLERYGVRGGRERCAGRCLRRTPTADL